MPASSVTAGGGCRGRPMIGSVEILHALRAGDLDGDPVEIDRRGIRPLRRPQLEALHLAGAPTVVDGDLLAGAAA